MNLGQTINFIKGMIKESDDAAAARSYQKILDWLNELLRFRLFLSEYENEYVLTNKKWHKNEEVLAFLRDEIADWRLKFDDE